MYKARVGGVARTEKTLWVPPPSVQSLNARKALPWEFSMLLQLLANSRYGGTIPLHETDWIGFLECPYVQVPR